MSCLQLTENGGIGERRLKNLQRAGGLGLPVEARGPAPCFGYLRRVGQETRLGIWGVGLP